MIPRCPLTRCQKPLRWPEPNSSRPVISSVMTTDARQSSGGVVVFRDTVGHVTGTYIQTMTPYLADRIDAALG